MQYDSEYPSDDAGILSYDGANIEVFPAPPGGIPQWGGLPNSTVLDIKVRETVGGYELWMSCLGRGIAVLDVVTDPVGVSEKPFLKPVYALTVWPNPATNKTEIAFNNEQSGPVHLAVYDLHGRVVKELINNTLGKGQQEISWDITYPKGQPVGAGIYIVRLSNSKETKSAKIVVR